MFEGILPVRLRDEVSALRRRIMIADRALAIPEAERTAWDVLCASAGLNAQSRGVIAERVVGAALGGERVCSSEDRGDVILDDRHYEVKSSFAKGRMNVRQIRPWQDTDYILIHVDVEDRDGCRAWRLTHEQMLDEVGKHGSVSHGTAGASAMNVNKEYSITVSRGPRSAMGARWDEKYRDPSLEAVLF